MIAKWARAPLCWEPAPHTTNKEQTPLPTRVRTRRIFHGGFFGVSGTPPVRDI
jgi:hypothetical protein